MEFAKAATPARTIEESLRGNSTALPAPMVLFFPREATKTTEDFFHASDALEILTAATSTHRIMRVARQRTTPTESFAAVFMWKVNLAHINVFFDFLQASRPHELTLKVYTT